MIKQKLLPLFMLAFATGFLWPAEENLDDLFASPEPDRQEEPQQKDHLASFVKEEKIKLSGYFEAIGGIGAGWTDWLEAKDPWRYFDGNIGLKTLARLYIDARPDPDFRFYGAFAATMNPMAGSASWTQFKISELFIDYTWLDAVFIRFGQHGSTWGQGRLFTESNLMAGSEAAFSLRASLPAFLNGVSAIVLAENNAASYKDLYYAGKAELVAWNTLLSLGAKYREEVGLKGLLSVKKVILGTDILADFLLSWDTRFEPEYMLLGGFFREWERIKLYGEYLGKLDRQRNFEQHIGLVLGYKKILGSVFNLGLDLRHEFSENSGYITSALVWKPWKYITVSLALPVVYGPSGSYYVKSENPDPAGRRLALLFGLEMKVSF